MIVDDIRVLWQHIQTTSWAAVFQAQGVVPDVAQWHQVAAGVDRQQPGFEDFAPDATRAIEPGDPAHSLIYHALASPRVRPSSDDWYPSLAELDLVENYIYSLKPLTPQQIEDRDLVPTVFAYEYRIKGKSTHGRHADLVFSRTGVARVGSRPALWDARNRCFTSRNGAASEFAVTPARYGVFLARRMPGNRNNLSFMGPSDGDDGNRQYLMPVHKLFDGSECVSGRSLAIDFCEMHINEKLRRLVTVGKVELAPGLDPDREPFIRGSRSSTSDAAPAGRLVDMVKAGSSVAVGALPAPLVRLAVQRQPGGPDRVACFRVPEKGPRLFDWRPNRRYTSMLVIEDLLTAAAEVLITKLSGQQRKIRPRNLPEFVNIRHRVKDPTDPASIEVLGDVIAARDAYVKAVDQGGYLAALYEDGICDGAVGACVGGLAGRTNAQPAYSLVTAPDFFPLADAMDLEEWVWTHTGDDGDSQFNEGGPEPLCFGRFPANPAIRSPYGDNAAAFDRSDQGMVAIVGRPMNAARGVIESGRRERTSFLSDAASNEFGPGWDVSFAGDSQGHFYATYGLGSPFPEDTKLCAAANAYWPAASPDASRTFRRTGTPTAIPLLDEELGFHPKHPRVQANEVAASLGWDGECGPFFMRTADGKQVVNYADILRSDYVTHALNGRLDRSKLAHIDSEELIRRMDCLRLCIQALPTDGNLFTSDGNVSSTTLWMVSATACDFDKPAETPHASLGSGGRGYRFEFVRLPRNLNDDDVVLDPAAPGRLLQSFAGPVYRCFVCRLGLCWQRDNAALEFVEAPPGMLFS